MIKLGRLQSPNVGSGQDEDVCCCEINAEENFVATGCEVLSLLLTYHFNTAYGFPSDNTKSQR
jgi:hypothetical protein